MAARKQLTGKQAEFLKEYLRNGRNGSAAYRHAYNTKGSPRDVGRMAIELLQHPRISSEIERAERLVSKSISDVIYGEAITKERIVRELARIAFSDPRRYFEWHKGGVIVKASSDLTDDEAAAVTEVSQTVTSEGGTIRVKLGDKRAALMDLAKLRGDIPEAERRVRIIKDPADLSDAELAALAAEQDADDEHTRH